MVIIQIIILTGATRCSLLKTATTNFSVTLPNCVSNFINSDLVLRESARAVSYHCRIGSCGCTSGLASGTEIHFGAENWFSNSSVVERLSQDCHSIIDSGR